MSDLKDPKPSRQARRAAERRAAESARPSTATTAGPQDIVAEVGDTVKRHRQAIVSAIESLDALNASDEEWILAIVSTDAREVMRDSVFGQRTGLYPVRREQITARIALYLKQNVDGQITPAERLGMMGLSDAASTPLECGHRSMILALTLGEQVCCPVCDYDVNKATEN